MTRLSAIVFGWEGTLVDTGEAVLHAYREATREVIGIPFPVTDGEVNMVTSMSAALSFSLLTDDRLTVEALLEQQQRSYTRLAPTAVSPMPKAAEVLHSLRERSMRIGAISLKSSSGVAVDIELCGLAGLIDAFDTADDARAAADPEAMLRCLRELGCCPEEALYVGEATDETIAARAAGIGWIVQLDSATSGARTADGVCHVRSIEDVLVLINSQELPIRPT